jgi:uncharacterized cupredoxin-like copper-binding protein
VVNRTSKALRLTTCFAAVGLLGIGAACGGSSSKSALSVRLSEWKIKAGPTTIDHGKQRLHITNAGTVPHELLVFRPDAGTDPKALPVSSDGDINEDGPGATKISDGDNVDPGKSQTRTVDFKTPGTYVLVCNITGHYKQGMSQIVTVK